MMRLMRGGPIALRACALLGPAALALHELRYLLGWGADAHGALASQGHGYLSLVTPLLMLLLTIGVGVFLARLAAGGQPLPDRRLELRRLWLLAAVALLVIYGSQELIEGALAPGHPSGLEGVFGAGGWTALPLASLFGAIVALLLCGAERALARAAARAASSWGVPVSAPAPAAAIELSVLRPGLARHLAGRAPPLLAS